MKTPTQAEVQSVLLKLQTGDRQSYFFEQLKNPEWLSPLEKEKVFAQPPRPVARGDSLYFPPWPPAMYLKNVAADRPEQVRAIVESITTNNPTVQSDLVEVMLRLPAPLAASLSPKADEWLKQRLFTRLPIVLTALTEYLLQNGEVKAGLRLAYQMLAVEEQERSVKNPIFDRPDAVGIISDWYYGQAATKITETLLKVAPLAGLKMLSRILLQALNIERRAQQEDDYSSIWMKNIDEEPRSNEVKEILAHRLLEFSESIVEQGLVPRADVYSYLRKQPSTIFQRIRLRVTARIDDLDAASAELLSAEFWQLTGIDPERSLLANRFLGRLNDHQLERAIAYLRLAVPVNTFTEWTKTTTGREPTEGDVRQFIHSRLLQDYAPIANVLRGSARDEYDRLKAELGEPEDVPETGEVWVGPTSPRSSQELAAMAPAAILALLIEWKPVAGFKQHSPEGLGRTLQPLVARAPQAYLAFVRDIAGLQPVYIRNILAGLSDAVKGKAITDWDAMVTLLEATVARSEGEFSPDFEHLDSFDADHDWSGLRHRMALLIEDNLRDDSFPVALAGRIWNVLEILSNDPNPTPEYEAKHGTSEPSNVALNSVRGAAMLAVVRYALWAYQRHEEGQLRDLKPWAGAFEVLTAHLDPAVDPSVAIRSVYGQYLPWLQKVDEEWLQENVARIFPNESEQAKLRSAAWNTYLVFCPLYQKTYEMLRGVYIQEVRNLDPSTPTDRFEVTARQHLAQHVWLVYARGQSDLADSESLISVFLAKASADLKADLISSVGRALQTDSTMTSEAIDRLCALWAVIINLMEGAQEPEKVRVLRQFGWWFASTKLDEEWVLEQLAVVLTRTGGRIDPEFQVLPRLAEISDRYPLQSIELLKQMAVALEPFHLMNIREHGGPIMRNAISAGGVARTAAEQVHTLLSNQGMREFRDLFVAQ